MKIDVKFSETNQTFDVKFDGNQVVTEYIGGELYNGDYIVVPKVEAQTMPTKGKVMADDLTVKEIPFFKASNTSGGNTVYIAKEI